MIETRHAGLSMLVDEFHAVIGREEFDRLMEYSMTLPTAPSPGRIWKRIETVRWHGADRLLLGEAVAIGDDEIGIHWRDILIVEGKGR